MEQKQPSTVEPLPDFVSLEAPQNGAESDRLLEAADLIWTHRRRILRWTIGFAIVTLIIGFLTPNTYRSTARLMPPDQGDNNMNLGALMMAAGKVSAALPSSMADLISGKDRGALFVDILTGRTVQNGVVQACDLRTVYGIPLLHLRASEEAALRRLKSSTLVVEDRKSGIISISASDHSPARAAAIAKAYVDQLDQLVATVSTSSARRERVFLEHRLLEVKSDLDSATQALSQFSSKTSTLEPKDQGKAEVEAAADLQGQLIAAEAQLKGLMAIYGDENTRVKSVRARAAELRRQLGILSGGDAGSPSNPAAPASMPYPSIRQLPLLGATYADLYRRVKIQETVYEVLTQQFEMAKVQEAKEIPTVKVVDQPYIPRLKDSPHLSLWLLAGTFLGFLCGTVLVIGQERWRQTDPQNPYKMLLLRIACDIRGHRWWKRGEGRLLKITANSRRRNGTQDPAA